MPLTGWSDWVDRNLIGGVPVACSDHGMEGAGKDRVEFWPLATSPGYLSTLRRNA